MCEKAAPAFAVCRKYAIFVYLKGADGRKTVSKNGAKRNNKA